MPVRHEEPREIDPSWLRRSLDKHYAWGLVFMAVLIAAFPIYKWREPDLRNDAKTKQEASYTKLGHDLFANTCAQCHGDNAAGGATAPTLNSKQFLDSTMDEQIQYIVSSGVPGSSMPAWSIDFGGTLTQQQILAVVTYLRSLEPNAPSIPDWRSGTQAK